MIIPMLCVTILVILVVWFLLQRVARLMIHTPSAISIFVCLSMVQLMAVFIFIFFKKRGQYELTGLRVFRVVLSGLGENPLGDNLESRNRQQQRTDRHP